MTRHELNNKYFEWMYQLVCDEKYSKRRSYRKLLMYLHNTEFTYSIMLDENRAEDGTTLRYRFGDECSYDGSVIATCLDDHPCSILEMMVALSYRCEEHIMEDSTIGNRTGQWFWTMIVNLGLGGMTDAYFDRIYVSSAVSRFLNHEYSRNGNGGLFTVEQCKRDLRKVEIWYQLCWYLDEILGS